MCVWQELVFSSNGVHIGRRTRAESGCFIIWYIFLQVRNKCGFCKCLIYNDMLGGRKFWSVGVGFEPFVGFWVTPGKGIGCVIKVWRVMGCVCASVPPPPITGNMVGGGWSPLPPMIRVSIRGLFVIFAYNQPWHVERNDGTFASNHQGEY